MTIAELNTIQGRLDAARDIQQHRALPLDVAISLRDDVAPNHFPDYWQGYVDVLRERGVAESNPYVRIQCGIKPASFWQRLADRLAPILERHI